MKGRYNFKPFIVLVKFSLGESYAFHFFFKGVYATNPSIVMEITSPSSR